MLPTYDIFCVCVCVCVLVVLPLLLIKKMRLAIFFFVKKWKIKNASCIEFWTCYWEHTSFFFFFGLKAIWTPFFFFFFSKSLKQEWPVCLHLTSVWRKAMRGAQFIMISSGQKLKKIEAFSQNYQGYLKNNNKSEFQSWKKVTCWDLVVDICDQVASLTSDRYSIYHVNIRTKVQNWQVFFSEIAGAIARTTEPILGLFVLISMHFFSGWIQMWQWKNQLNKLKKTHTKKNQTQTQNQKQKQTTTTKKQTNKNKTATTTNNNNKKFCHLHSTFLWRSDRCLTYPDIIQTEFDQKLHFYWIEVQFVLILLIFIKQPILLWLVSQRKWLEKTQRRDHFEF